MDPRAHMTTFYIATGQNRFKDGEQDTKYCQLFVENLAGAALSLFSRLEANTINFFYQLSIVFMKHNFMFIEERASYTNMWTIFQRKEESLRSFFGRFKTVLSNIVVSEGVGISALRNAL